MLTHGHIDHIKNAAYLSNRLQVPIAMYPDDMELIETPRAQTLYPNGMMGNMMLRMSNRNFDISIAPFTPAVLLHDNDILKEFGINTTIIHLPGHTNGSIGIDIDNTCLIVGDTFMNIVYPCSSSA